MVGVNCFDGVQPYTIDDVCAALDLSPGVPVLLHRVNFRPSFLAHARRVGWDQSVNEFKERCLTAAPRPQPDATS